MSTVTLTQPTTGTWTLDPAHTRVGFAARHLMTSKVRGSFGAFAGTIEVADDITESAIDVSIETASVTTGAADRDNHLRSGDFFDAGAFPVMRFRSTSIAEQGDGSYRIAGDLTIKDVTRPVTLDATYLGTVTDPWGNEKVAFEAATKLNREDWGLTWNAPLEAGGWLVSKEITVEIEGQAAKA